LRTVSCDNAARSRHPNGQKIADPIRAKGAVGYQTRPKCLRSFLMVQCRWATYSMSCSQQELWNGMVENIAKVTLERNKIMVLIHSSTISMLNKILVAASIVFPLYIIELDILAPPGTYGRSKLMTKSKVSWDMSASSVHALWKSLLIHEPFLSDTPNAF
jgi:hypothetical protein